MLVNVNILTEGVDLPQTKTVFLARPTISTILMTQMVGRALRGEKAGGTKEAYIVSFVDEEREKEKLAADLLVAQKTSENKSHFLSSVSHELRTPINAVLGLDEMILRECGDETIVEYATEIQNAGKSLLGLVNDILDSSKLEEGKMELNPTEYELSSSINDLINMIAVKAQDKNLQLNVNVDEETPNLLYGDEIRLKQVILNILTNAVKYTKKGGITFSVSFKEIKNVPDCVLLHVSVTNTGIGIRQEDMDRLFSKFERLEEKRNRNIEGTGLGMTITRSLLHLMGSEVKVTSTYGEGSSFSFDLKQRVIDSEPLGDYALTQHELMLQNKSRYREKLLAPLLKEPVDSIVLGFISFTLFPIFVSITNFSILLSFNII